MPGKLLPLTARARTAEKVPAVAGFGQRLRLIPWWDGNGREPPEFRRVCREMVHESNVKGAILDKVFSVASLDLQVHPASDDARDGLIADGFRACFEGMDGGLRGFFEQVVLNGLIDNHAVCEKVWKTQERGRWAGQWVYRAVKFKDHTNLVADEFNNVVGVRSNTGASPQEWDAADFVVFIHLPLFGRLTGTSDFRAAYKGWWLIATVDEMRALAAEKFSTPFLQGEYPPGDDATRHALEAAMEAAAGQTWVSIPIGTRTTLLDLATRGAADYQAFKDDMRRDIFLGICGAVLQAVEGTTTGGRGSSAVHRGTADTRSWYLSSVAAQLIQQQMLPEYVDSNYLGSPAYPTVSIGSVNDAEMAPSLTIDQGLQQMGFKPSKRELSKRYGRQFASAPDDALEKPAPAAAGQAPGGGPGLPFSEGDPDADPDPGKAAALTGLLAGRYRELASRYDEATASAVVDAATALFAEHGPGGQFARGGGHVPGKGPGPKAAKPAAAAKGTAPAAKKKVGASAAHPGATHGSSVTVKPTKTRAFAGKPVATRTTLTKQETGRVGEAVIIGYLKSQGFPDARPMNSGQTNFPVDALEDHRPTEIKAGLVSNTRKAQQWRLTFSKESATEKALYEKMTPAERAGWNAEKQKRIHARKQAAIAALEKMTGKKVRPRTMTVIINPDTRTADVYEFDGFHDRVDWQSDMAKKGYKGSVQYG